MILSKLICDYVDNNKTITNKKEYIYALISELEFVYDIYENYITDSDSESDDDESDTEPEKISFSITSDGFFYLK